jgi:hypothetical protein
LAFPIREEFDEIFAMVEKDGGIADQQYGSGLIAFFWPIGDLQEVSWQASWSIKAAGLSILLLMYFAARTYRVYAANSFKKERRCQ